MAATRMLDRVTGRPVTSLPPRAALGRYLTQTGDYHLGKSDISLADLPDVVTVEAILEIGRRLSKLAHRQASLSDLMEISPLVDRAAARRTLGWQPLEQHIDDHLPFLRSVCFRPADRLRRIDRLLPVPRVRRITVNTITRMAAHSEDWASLHPDGVRPERALSPERESDVDLYENRVVAHLAEQLWRYLTGRISQIRGVGDMFSDIQRYLEDISRRPFQRSNLRLWEMVLPLSREEDWQAHAALRLAELEQQRMGLSRLRSSPVWRGTNRRIELGTVLRTTNLFTGEERYRDVAQLWHHWMDAQTQNLSEKDVQRHIQQWCEAFVSYTAMLVMRAADELGATPAAPARVGEPVTYLYAGTSFTLHLGPDGVIVLSRGDEPLLRIAPLPHAVTASRHDKVVQAELEALQAEPPGVATLVLYPGMRDERRELTFPVRLRAFEPPGLAVAQGRSVPLWLMPVSPLEIDSVTRLARTVRWVLEQARLAGYPFDVKCGPTMARAIASQVTWLSARTTGLMITRLPAEHELANARGQILTAQDQNRFVRHGIERAEAETVWRDIQEAVERTTELTRCPVCGMSVPQPDRAFQRRDDGSFRCSCVCGAGWEGRICRMCTRLYPVLDLPAGTAAIAMDGDQIDRFLGVDMLAAPCAIRERVFLCPWCSTCGNAQTNMDCVRCTARM